MKHIKKFNEILDPMGDWKVKSDTSSNTSSNRLGIDDIQVGDRFIDDEDVEVECVELITDPTNFSPLRTIVGDNDMCYGYTLGGWSSIKRKL